MGNGDGVKFLTVSYLMSTRSSIWLGENEGKNLHIYWELADRDIELGQKLGKMVAPVDMAIDDGDADRERVIRLPKETAEILLDALCPTGWRDGYDVI